jgi:cytochrome P450
VLTRYEDAHSVLMNSDTYSSRGRVSFLLDQLDDDVRARTTLLRNHYATGLAHTDGDDHRRLRKLLSRGFTPRMIEDQRPRVAAMVAEMLDEHDDQMDLIADLFTPLPARIVGSMLGSTDADIPDLIRWAHAINGLYEKGGHIAADRALAAETALEEIRSFVQRLSEERRVQWRAGTLDPERDVLSALVFAETEGQALTEAELVSTVVTLFVAGHETTTHLLGNGFLALLSSDQWSVVVEHPELTSKAVEEMARFDGSVPRSWRIASTDVVIGGQNIPKGSLVLPMLAAANRDPAVFSEPDRLDITRDSRKHIAYGSGIHVCLGAPLARIEAQETIKALARRAPNAHLAVDPETLRWRRDVALRGLICLPVRLAS